VSEGARVRPPSHTHTRAIPPSGDALRASRALVRRSSGPRVCRAGSAGRGTPPALTTDAPPSRPYSDPSRGSGRLAFAALQTPATCASVNTVNGSLRRTKAASSDAITSRCEA
jgi:hypothetical protein